MPGASGTGVDEHLWGTLQEAFVLAYVPGWVLGDGD